ncbi:hypothetical protein HTZ84_04970 [Haloterrigena sp. SYSU A558-1]|uniref:Uncharacterized protein n=1 Tax=Haloterrigena gelatinilytica TaxID=2741724 RepID=A0ABX2L8H6_9EURY|nr:hypothetical protein [Haloterrigena gelatinilytica]NUC71668.1 hypothetical protein [Haloterrigena gelatinilytica]
MSKVRYVAFYDDPEAGENEVLTRYVPDKPRDVVHLMNWDTEVMRECELIGYGSLGDWTTLEEAEERADEIAEEVFGGDDDE